MSHISFKEIIKKCHQSKSKNYKWYYAHRLISLPLTKFFYRFNVQPNSISIWMIVLTLVSFTLMINTNIYIFFLGYFIAFIAFLFDKVDGDLARLYSIDNLKGTVLDFVYHRTSLFLFYLGIGIHFSNESEYIIVLALIAGFFANYIEEMQLLSYRTFAHKYLLKNENLHLQDINTKTESRFFRIFKIFRNQLFLFYYFIFGILLKYQFDFQITTFIKIALFSILIYSFYQLYYVLKVSFDNDINALYKQLNKNQ